MPSLVVFLATVTLDPILASTIHDGRSLVRCAAGYGVVLCAAAVAPFSLLLLPTIFLVLALAVWRRRGEESPFDPAWKMLFFNLAWAAGTGMGFLGFGPSHIAGVEALTSPFFHGRWLVNTSWLLIAGPAFLFFFARWTGGNGQEKGANTSGTHRGLLLSLFSVLALLSGMAFRWWVPGQLFLGQALLAVAFPLAGLSCLLMVWRNSGFLRLVTGFILLVLVAGWAGWTVVVPPRLALHTPFWQEVLAELPDQEGKLVLTSRALFEIPGPYPWQDCLQGRFQLENPEPTPYQNGDFFIRPGGQTVPWFEAAMCPRGLPLRVKGLRTTFFIFRYRQDLRPPPLILMTEKGFTPAVTAVQGMFADGIWTRSRCEVPFHGNLAWSNLLEIQLRGWRPDHAPGVEELLKVTLDGDQLKPVLIQQTYLSFRLPDSPAGSLDHLLILESGTFIPSEGNPSSHDGRMLGLDLESIVIR